MNLKPLALAVTSVIALAGFSAPVASAQSGDAQAPQNRAQCKKFLKRVDAALVYENKRYAKQFAKLEKKRTALQTRAMTLGPQQAEIERRMTEIQTALEDQANPLSDEEQTRLVDEYNSLIPTSEQNLRDLQSITDELDGLTFEVSQLKKTHTLNVRSTIKYRKQVATYCKKLKK
jgi:septal ring factor EnvC (AmiA/AmiB activator)